ncbi:hypothetical protein NLJ89_g5545 [Agrocybe chaxingu]|uniref:BTB domain-containing protein n=1 Tax=Agrocybe chaxingu TaxID=84603 RepID=A0A9W8MUX0_9AGAR|nr:hypothetical protein NLJ89_g5545 [Agrocybe chaxingu]
MKTPESKPSGGDSRPQPVRDEDFYFQNAVILVEDVLFKIPKSYLVSESAVFETMFSLPQNQDEPVEGETDHHPIQLEGVKHDDFKQLLSVICVRAHQPAPNLTNAQWLSVLELATKWDMARLRTLAITRLTSTLSEWDAHKQIVLGQKYEHKPWVVSGYTILMRRANPMGVEDVERIGLADTLKISALRERISTTYDYSRTIYVEDTLFRVPKNSFLKADPDSIFPTMFNLPVSGETISEGVHDSYPIMLEGVSKAYFEGFLLVMYPFKRTAVTFEEWIGALDLATMWSFSEIRGKAISALTDMLVKRNPLQNLLLARKYQVRQWLKQSLLQLVEDETLELRTLRRGGSLDWETIARIFAVQARLMRRKPLLTPAVEVERMFYDELRELNESQGISHRRAPQCPPLPVTYSEDTMTGQVAVTPSDGKTGPSRHSIYYMDVITALVSELSIKLLFQVVDRRQLTPGQVAGTLFRIPKEELLQSGATFGEIYGLSAEREAQSHPPLLNGLGVQYPITLEGVSEEHFVGFLDAMYPLGESSASFGDWIGALELATRWKFDKCITKILQIRHTILSSQRQPSNGNPFEHTNFACRTFDTCRNCQRSKKALCEYRCGNLEVHPEPDTVKEKPITEDEKKTLIEAEFADELLLCS